MASVLRRVGRIFFSLGKDRGGGVDFHGMMGLTMCGRIRDACMFRK